MAGNNSYHYCLICGALIDSTSLVTILAATEDMATNDESQTLFVHKECLKSVAHKSAMFHPDITD